MLQSSGRSLPTHTAARAGAGSLPPRPLHQDPAGAAPDVGGSTWATAGSAALSPGKQGTPTLISLTKDGRTSGATDAQASVPSPDSRIFGLTAAAAAAGSTSGALCIVGGKIAVADRAPGMAAEGITPAAAAPSGQRAEAPAGARSCADTAHQAGIGLPGCVCRMLCTSDCQAL